ncbi:MAG TPA: hypothetical protein VGO58_18605 [Chitinophagaceae bacterium]|jgi:hypothetical protein|nr:hypothetical protein [Chitinophagaceae bacterium]
MKFLTAALLTIIVCAVSCTKEKQSDENIIGQWKWEAQYLGSPVNTQTPQNTGIQETLVFGANNHWSLIQNGTEIKSGDFMTSVVTGRDNQKVKSLRYSSATNTDSTVYYTITGNALQFSNDLIGTVGSGARVYSKQ